MLNILTQFNLLKDNVQETNDNAYTVAADGYFREICQFCTICVHFSKYFPNFFIFREEFMKFNIFTDGSVK